MRRTPARWTAWLFAVVLLLEAAVPLLATASAYAQGKALVEVCTVYGVATVALDGQGSAPQPDQAEAHAAEHCVLSGIVALAATGSMPSTTLPHRQAGAVEPTHRCPPAHDACATWVTRIHHGPPVLA